MAWMLVKEGCGSLIRIVKTSVIVVLFQSLTSLSFKQQNDFGRDLCCTLFLNQSGAQRQQKSKGYCENNYFSISQI